MRVALYVRVSTRSQVTDNQQLRLMEIVRSRGYYLHDVYCDIASGADQRRPELDRMLQDAKRHLFDKIIAVKIDRLARSIINLYETVRLLDEYRVQLEIIDQPIDTSTSSGMLITNVLAAVAEFERELISDRTRDGQNRARREGKTIGRPARTLSQYQVDKIKQLLGENPEMSQRELAEHFAGISRTKLIELARVEGLI
ncbi:MAG: recombinase family protein [Gudongella sp.]|nr:recombinase family protein [Gudongella sp.]